MASPFPLWSNSDELFFESQSPTQNSPSKQDHESSSPSYLAFDPVVSSVVDIEATDWRRYDPPAELLVTQIYPEREIQGILETSILRIRARHAEEGETRAAAARQERPLGRVGRAVFQPKGKTLTSSLVPCQATRIHRTSEASVTTNDSGYESESGLKSGRLITLGNLFKRRKMAITIVNPLQNTFSNTIFSSSSIVSPISKSSTVECVSCMEDFAPANLVKLSCHSYCSRCFQKLISIAMESETQWPAKCCLNPIPSSQIIKHVSSSTKKLYIKREAEWSIPASDRMYCAKAGCNAWIPPKNINKQENTAKCSMCSHIMCSLCRGASHVTIECPQDPVLQATISLAERQGWKRCYYCKTLVEYVSGCHHITCRCKAQFCYVCGLKWRTCKCSYVELAALRERAVLGWQPAVFQPAPARQTAEDDDLRIALQLVADFEREEAERLAQEAEAERLRVQADRVQREREWVVSVNRHFLGLHNELRFLDVTQRQRMIKRYKSEVVVRNRRRDLILYSLSKRHSTEIEVLEMESGKRIVAFEHKFNQEHQLRLAEEQRTGGDYVDKICKYWNGEPDAENKVRDARDARDKLRKDQEKEYRFWDVYRRKELLAITEGEQKKMETLRVKHVGEVKEAEGRAELEALEWERKKWAEGMWVEAVAREREDILFELEQVEYTRVV